MSRKFIEETTNYIILYGIIDHYLKAFVHILTTSTVALQCISRATQALVTAFVVDTILITDSLVSCTFIHITTRGRYRSQGGNQQGH